MGDTPSSAASGFKAKWLMRPMASHCCSLDSATSYARLQRTVASAVLPERAEKFPHDSSTSNLWAAAAPDCSQLALIFLSTSAALTVGVEGLGAGCEATDCCVVLQPATTLNAITEISLIE